MDGIRNINATLDSLTQSSQRQSLYVELFLKNCPDMIFIFDEQLRLIACSEACRPFLRGKKAGELINLPFKDIFSPDVEADWVEKLYQQNKETLHALCQRDFEGEITTEGKTHTHIQVAISPILGEGKACRGTIMTLNDITKLIETKRHAEEAARSKSSFLANMSHEIRTPMNAVKGLSELLALTELSSLQRNYVKNIISSANSLLGIINDILDFSKIDANKIEFIESPYDLAGLITGVCNVVSMRADEKNLPLMINAAPDLPCALSGDDVRIKQVITNLLSNAIKYTNEGYVRFNVHTEDRDGKTLLWCAVEDTGIGIKQEDIPTLFDAFARADLIANRSIAGTGLGLAISKQLATAMGGDIMIESVHGKGSVFTFYVPQTVADPRPIASVDNPQTKRVLLLGDGVRVHNLRIMLDALGINYTHVKTQSALDEAGTAAYTHCIADGGFSERVVRTLYSRMPDCLFAALKNMRHAMSVADYHDTILYLPVFVADLARFLSRDNRDANAVYADEPADEKLTLNGVTALVVDDNEINLIVSSEMMRSLGADVVCASSGDEAIALCKKQKFDIIFMDHMMPGKDGIETTIEIRRAQCPSSETPIVALTANVVNGMEGVYLSNGMDDFIGKPIEIAEINKVFHKWLPKEKFGAHGGIAAEGAKKPGSQLLAPEELIAAFDNFGLYSSDVMREMNGDFDGYIARMDEASKVLGEIVQRLKSEVSGKRWDDFSKDCLELRVLLYGVGARDCAARARKLAIAARERNIDYIYEDFFSLMGNMYMLDKKLEVIGPFVRGNGDEKLPLGSPQYLHGCLEKMGRALQNVDAVEAMVQLENAAAFSLDMELDMALKAIKVSLEKGDYESAAEHHAAIFRVYTQRMAQL